MPLYRCTIPQGSLSTEQRAAIAKQVTAIHCEETGAPKTFVHVFFFDMPSVPAPEYRLHGSIRAGRTDAQKDSLRSRMRDALANVAGVGSENVAVTTNDVPAKWVMEGGVLLPEPGEEAGWLAEHHTP